MVYREQLGLNLQAGGSNGDTNRRYALIVPTKAPAKIRRLVFLNAGPKFLKRPVELVLEIGVTHPSRRRARGDDEVQIPTDVGRSSAEDLPQPASERVAYHGVTDLLRYRQTQARSVQNIGIRVYGKQLAPVNSAALVNPVELPRLGDAGSSGASRQELNGQTLAASSPAIRYDPASADRLHALAEAVGFGSLAAFGLICALHRLSLWITLESWPTEYSLNYEPYPTDPARRVPAKIFVGNQDLTEKIPAKQALFFQSNRDPYTDNQRK